MRNYTLKNYEDKLNKQVVHMDQAVCYCPEFRATKKMHDYPSRKLQLARAVYKGELEGNDYITNIMFKSILSRQGERWQNFGECPEDCTDAMILSREMLVKQGFAKSTINELKATLKDNNGHIFKETEELNAKWKKYMPLSEASSIYLMLDDATYTYASESARLMGEFFSKKEIAFYPEIKSTYMGWEYFAYGLIDEGQEHFKKIIEELEDKEIDTIVTLTGQSHYIWKTFLEKLDLQHNFRIVNILEYSEQLKVNSPTYLYAGTFYTRYLRMENDINGLVVNDKEEVIKNSAEFNPLLTADKRINKVTIWQKPISAEYLLLGMEEEVKNYILEDALADIKKGTQNMTIVFEPFAYNKLSILQGTKSVMYFIDALS